MGFLEELNKVTRTAAQIKQREQSEIERDALRMAQQIKDAIKRSASIAKFEQIGTKKGVSGFVAMQSNFYVKNESDIVRKGIFDYSRLHICLTPSGLQLYNKLKLILDADGINCETIIREGSGIGKNRTVKEYRNKTDLTICRKRRLNTTLCLDFFYEFFY